MPAARPEQPNLKRKRPGSGAARKGRPRKAFGLIALFYLTYTSRAVFPAFFRPAAAIF
jgi:hypothetical protein